MTNFVLNTNIPLLYSEETNENNGESIEFFLNLKKNHHCSMIYMPFQIILVD